MSRGISIPKSGSAASARSKAAPPESISYEQPLYTEIRIPLPPIPKQYAYHSRSGSASTPRSRAASLASLSPFHRRRASSPAAGAEDKTHSTASLIKNLRRKKPGAVDALAVVPAVTILSTELFTPSEKRKEGEAKKGD